MQAQQQGDNFKTLKILHLALLSGLTMLALISLFMRLTGDTAFDESVSRILQVIAAVLSTGMLLLGFNLFRKKIMEARNSTEAGQKRMELYRTACIIWWAMIEAPGLFAMICFLLTGNYAFFALGFFHIVILAVFMPRKENIIVLLNLSSKEVDELSGQS